MIPDWMEEIEQDLATCLCNVDAVSPAELAQRLGISESSAISLICLLAPEGHVTIERVSLPRTQARGGDGEPYRPHRPAGPLGAAA